MGGIEGRISLQSNPTNPSRLMKPREFSGSRQRNQRKRSTTFATWLAGHRMRPRETTPMRKGKKLPAGQHDPYLRAGADRPVEAVRVGLHAFVSRVLTGHQHVVQNRYRPLPPHRIPQASDQVGVRPHVRAKAILPSEQRVATSRRNELETVTRPHWRENG